MISWDIVETSIKSGGVYFVGKDVISREGCCVRVWWPRPRRRRGEKYDTVLPYGKV